MLTHRALSRQRIHAQHRQVGIALERLLTHLQSPVELTIQQRVLHLHAIMHHRIRIAHPSYQNDQQRHDQRVDPHRLRKEADHLVVLHLLSQPPHPCEQPPDQQDQDGSIPREPHLNAVSPYRDYCRHHAQQQHRREICQRMRAHREWYKGIDDELYRPEHQRDEHSSQQGMITRHAMTHHMLSHHHDIRLEEIEPAERENHKNNSTHQPYAEGATVLITS